MKYSPLDKLLLKLYRFYYSIKVKFMSSEAIIRSIRKDYHLDKKEVK